MMQNFKALVKYLQYPATMSLACLSCQNVTRTHSDLRSYSIHSQDEEKWGGSAVSCWSSNKRNPQHHDHPAAAEITVKTRVVPVPPSSSVASRNSTNQDPVSPRLVRCHAVRRDIFRDWHFEDFPEGNRLCLT
ncbi:hypothetical protein SUGI_0936010 [Cryptomeria japonica]|uniref:uncharacterized protein LOC131037957 n=1 Tax=Cryptomeria japonica TaxID=3369 RepID=UPI0024146C3C|nr:uncharacterized protein LOC131037957 [Cryptomeria japonica]GLJ44559.1 hypothetical protein SUGI_0936010 [Cryptomeria japonica]